MNFFKVYLILLALLTLTVALAFAPLGEAAKPIALLIAFTKAGLVLYYFMGLREAKPLLRIAAFAGLGLVFILFSFTFTDYLSRGTIGVLGK